MKTVLLDTNAYVAFKSGYEEAIEIISLADTIFISVVVLGELLAGFITGSRETRNREELSEFLRSPRVSLLKIDDATTEYYAHVFRQLKKAGKPIPTNDLWIAAAAMQKGGAVFTYDRHFAAVDNLIVCRKPSDLLP